ncbi:MAG TPA: hypothetical protein VKV40_20250 [Ktedonobacteraceae bacterium]|nr:hypothetical protein [Ktedonobacteraceae bacterium]
MHKRPLPIVFTVMLTLLFSLFFMALPAGAHGAKTTPVAQSSRAVSFKPLSTAAAKALAYWTPARMQAAIPMQTPQPEGKVTPSAPTTGPSGSGNGVAALSIYANKVKHTKYGQYPYSTVGKVFFTDPVTGYDYVCSGASVNGTNLNTVDTAGHCVVEGGSGSSPDWYTNWIFCPQYFKGSTPYGCWAEYEAWTWSDWINSGSLEDDFGDVAVYNNSYGYGNLVNVVGGTGWAYNYSPSKTFTDLGYPAESPYNGNLMYSCKSTGTGYSYDDGTVVETTCDMTGGCSGGPWLTSIKGVFGYVNGHNDFRYTNDPQHLYSPYYDYDWYQVFYAAENTSV